VNELGCGRFRFALDSLAYVFMGLDFADGGVIELEAPLAGSSLLS
jgi:hypothetical protein